MMNTNKLVGCWALRLFEWVMPDGSLQYPFGKDEELTGYLMYHPNGYLSVNFGTKNRSHPDKLLACYMTAEKKINIAETFVGYAGRYEVDQGKDVVYHIIDVALVPGMVGGRHTRAFRLDGANLYIEADIKESDVGIIHINHIWTKTS